MGEFFYVYILVYRKVYKINIYKLHQVISPCHDIMISDSFLKQPCKKPHLMVVERMFFCFRDVKLLLYINKWLRIGTKQLFSFEKLSHQ